MKYKLVGAPLNKNAANEDYLLYNIETFKDLVSKCKW